ncbi:unnamed protein product [Amaranthus hypochondriacus]
MSSKCAAGGLKPVDPNSPKIQEVSAWAVNEYNNQHPRECVRFEKALKAAEQVVNGIMYHIEMEVAVGDALLHKVEAKVVEQAWLDKIQLVEFKFIDQKNACIAIPN